MFSGIMGGISGILNTVTGGLSSTANALFGSKTGGKIQDVFGLRTPAEKFSMDMAEKQFKHQTSMDERNYQHSLAQWQNELAQQAYQKELQERLFAREDTGIQRRVADLRAAGLSPVLAAGQAAPAGQGVAITPAHAPRYDVTADRNIAGAIAERAEERKMMMMSAVMNLIQQSSQISHTKADTDRIRAEMDWITPEHERRIRETELHAIGAAASMMQAETSAANVRLSARKWDEAERILVNARSGHLNTYAASERLRALGIPYETSRKAIEAAMAGHDAQLSVGSGIRTTDSLPAWAKTSDRLRTSILPPGAKEPINIVDAELRKMASRIAGESQQVPSHIDDYIKKRRYGSTGTRRY